MRLFHLLRYCRTPLEDPLSSATYENSEKFVVPVTRGKVVRVYDGDTITLAFCLNGKSGCWGSTLPR